VAFRGIYPAAELTPSEFGLLSVARVTSHTARNYDERWIRGFSFEFDSRPTVRLLEDGGADVHTLFDGTGLDRYIEVTPFFIEVEDYRSTFSLTGEDRFARVLKQIEAVTQKAIERELWSGYVTRTDATTNQYLSNTSTLTYASSTPQTAVTAWRAVALLESGLASSPIGEEGVMHITRDIAIQLVSDGSIIRDDRAFVHLETINGAKVVSGSGYTGDGPILEITGKEISTNVATITTATSHYLLTGETVVVSGVDATFDGTYAVTGTPTPTTFTYAKTAGDVSAGSATGSAQMKATQSVKWIYATGSVDVHLGKSEVVNDTLAQGYDVSGNQNDMRIKALRPAAVYFDPAVHYAVKVDLTA
jgi:hypothetical protein